MEWYVIGIVCYVILWYIRKYTIRVILMFENNVRPRLLTTSNRVSGKAVAVVHHADTTVTYDYLI